METKKSPNERLLKILQAPENVQAQIDQALEGKSPPKEALPSGPLLYGMTAAARLLGVSRATLWRMIKSGKLHKVEILPNSFRVRRKDLEDLVTHQEKST